MGTDLRRGLHLHQRALDVSTRATGSKDMIDDLNEGMVGIAIAQLDQILRIYLHYLRRL